jgi:hypothetical protein
MVNQQLRDRRFILVWVLGLFHGNAQSNIEKIN